MRVEPGSNLQRNIYDFIVSFIQAQSMPPTIREIGRALGITSTSHINHHLRMLEKQGWIIRTPGKSRGIKLARRPAGIPIIGTIAAGAPLDVFPDGVHGTLLEQPCAERGTLYALRVKGCSMREDAIYDGDHVIIQPQSTCHNGEIVVALHLQEGISGSATLKRFFQEQDHVRLQPANSEMEPLLIPKQEWDREWRVQGKVIAIVRSWEPTF